MLREALKSVSNQLRFVFRGESSAVKRAQKELHRDSLAAPPDSVECKEGAAFMPTKMEAVATLAARQLTYAEITGDPPPPPSPTTFGAGSRLCCQADLATDGFRYWMHRMKLQPAMHRKLWEWYFITDALWRLNMLCEGRRGLGFGVGQEPLTPLFAVHGCDLVATDMDVASAEAAGWTKTQEHASTLATLDKNGIASPQIMTDQVVLRTVDMNSIPEDLRDFDFCWSSCSLEHLGSLQHGIDFVVNSMRCLRPGGVALHTTEFNLNSDDSTFESPGLSLYRRRDIETLVARLESEGHKVEPINWSKGSGFIDKFVDLPPFSPSHLRIRLADFDCTSIGLVIHARA